VVVAIEHVSMQCRRQDARHVLCVDGHSRHVVVHLSAGLHVSVDEHQPQPGESSWQPHTSVAAAHTSDEDTLNVRATSFACAAAASSSESACSLRCIDDQVLSVARFLFRPTILQPRFSGFPGLRHLESMFAVAGDGLLQ